MSPPIKNPARRERKRLTTRRALLDAGQQLLAGRVMESITIDEIVDAADVAKGSFYNHFIDKQDLASALLGQLQSEVETRIADANREVEDAAERMVRALGVLLCYGIDHPERVQALLSLSQRRTVAESPLNAGLAADLRRGIESGRFRGIDLETGVLLVVGTFMVILRHVTMSGSPTPVGALAGRVGAGLLRGLGLDFDDSLRVAGQVADILLETPKS